MFVDRRVLAIVALLAVAACGGDDDGGGGDTIVISPGTGEPNVEPLWTLHAGYAIHGRLFLETEPTVLLPPREIGGRTVYRLLSGGGGAQQYAGPLFPHTGYLEPYPSEPIPLQYLSEDDDGIWFHGAPREGILADKVLIVPREVRVGMKWEARSGGERRFVFEVVGRAVEDTPFGRRPVWTFDVYDERHPTDAYNQVRYVEGRGLLPVTLALGIVPLEAQPALDAGPALAVTAVGGMQLDNNYPVFASAIDDGGTLGVTMYTRVPAFGLDPLGNVTVGDQGSVSCHAYDPDTRAFTTTTDCAEAAGTSIGADGSVAQILVQSAQLGAPFPENNCEPFNECLQYAGSAVYRALDGHARMLIDSPLEFQIGDHAGFVGFDNATNVRNYGAALGRLPGGGLRWVVEDAEGTTVAQPGITGLGVARLEADDVWRGLHVATHLAGHVAVRSSRAGFDRIRTSADGTIDRLRLGPDGVTIERLGEVSLPAGNILFAAFEYPAGQLLMFSNHDYERFHEQFGEILAWRAPIPASTIEAPPPIIDGITAVAVGPDLRVCWRPGAGAPALTGWLLGGLEPAVVVPAGLDGNCVLLVRSWVEPVSLTLPGAYAAEGTIPGAGRVAIGMDPPVTGAAEVSSEPVMAPLAGGGSVGARAIYGEGETPGETHVGYDELGCEVGVADLAGAGLWCGLARIDADGIHDVSLLPGETSTGVAAAGGGLVLQAGSSYTVVDADGARHPLGIVAGEVLSVVTPDGIACGGSDSEIVCVDPTGAHATGTLRPTRVIDRWLATGDVVYGSLLAPGEVIGATDPALVRFAASDPATILEIDYATLGIAVTPGAFTAIDFATAPDGTGYALVTVDDVAHLQRFVVRLDPTAPVTLDYPELGLLGQSGEVRFSVEDELIIVRATDGDVPVLHLPRS